MHTKDLRTATVSHPARSDIRAFLFGFALTAAILTIGAVSVTRGATAGDPMAIVQNTVDQVLGVLKDHQTPTDVRRHRLIQLVEGHFDFTDMARSSLGYHWRQLTPPQRQQFVPLFTSFMEGAYLNKLEGYSGQKIEFLNKDFDGPDHSQVNTRVMQPNAGQPIRLDYRLKQEGGDWKVYDVTVDGISITANYRNQFNRVINNDGFDTLMNKMRSKQQELIASLGNSRPSGSRRDP